MKTSRKKTKLAAFAAMPLFALAITIITSGFCQQAIAQNPPSSKLFAVGAITTAALDHVAFSAHNSPKSDLATAVTGYVVQQYANATSNSGPVTCLQLSGTMAIITFMVKNGPDEGQYRSFVVMDGGQPVMGVPTMDGYSDCGISTNICGGGVTCASTLQPPLRGNIVVSQDREASGRRM